MNSECQFDPEQPNDRKARWADTVIQGGHCRHVAKIEIWRGESDAYAVLGARCVTQAGKYDCEKPCSEKLFWFALRRLSKKTSTLKGRISTHGTPSDLVQIFRTEKEQGRGDKEFVLFPCSSQDPLPSENGEYGVAFTPSEGPKHASIDLSFIVWQDRPNAEVHNNLNLSVLIPPVQELSQGIHIEPSPPAGGPVAMDEITTTVVAESIRLLIEGGWSFFKKFKEGGGDLIQLNIGEVEIPVSPSEKPDTAALEPAIRKSPTGLTNSRLHELKGYNELLERKAVALEDLLKLADEGVPIERAQTGTAIRIKEKEIKEVREKMWAILEETGVTVSQRRVS
jgi:hypothetical protein